MRLPVVVPLLVTVRVQFPLGFSAQLRTVINFQFSNLLSVSLWGIQKVLVVLPGDGEVSVIVRFPLGISVTVSW